MQPGAFEIRIQKKTKLELGTLRPCRNAHEEEPAYSTAPFSTVMFFGVIIATIALGFIFLI